MTYSKRWKIVTTLPNGNQLSTVELPFPKGAYESCWFYAENFKGRDEDGSEVVATYDNAFDAFDGHIDLLSASPDIYLCLAGSNKKNVDPG
jgi:hypothetical protein